MCFQNKSLSGEFKIREAYYANDHKRPNNFDNGVNIGQEIKAMSQLLHET